MIVELQQIKIEPDGKLMLQECQTGKWVRWRPGMFLLPRPKPPATVLKYDSESFQPEEMSQVAKSDEAFRDLEKEAWQCFIESGKRKWECFIDGVIVGAVCVSLLWMLLLA